MDEKNEASKRLVLGTAVYMVGNLTSKILQMLILPIITVNLSTSEYGYYDLIITTINLVTPFITLQIVEGMFRYLFDSDHDEKIKNVSTTTAFLLFSMCILAIIICSLSLTTHSIKYPFLIYLNYISVIIFDYMQKIARVQQKNKIYATSGVINTIVMLICQAIMLIVFKMKTEGMLIANFVSYFVSAFYIQIHVRVDKWISKKAINKVTLWSLLKYSAPLMPNSIVWWLVASSDRYIITFFLGTAENGIYSIAGKFSQLLTFVVTVFQLAWQENAIMEKNSTHRDKFYTDTFNSYMRLLLGGYLIALPAIRLLIPVLLDTRYQCGYLYNPILLIGAIMSAFSQFYGSAYLVFRKTSGAFFTTVVAAIINIMIGIGLIGKIGLFAPALGTSIAFAVQWCLRSIQMRSYFKVKIDIKVLICLLICCISVTCLYYIDNKIIHIVTLIIGMCLFVLFNGLFIKNILKKVRR